MCDKETQVDAMILVACKYELNVKYEKVKFELSCLKSCLRKVLILTGKLGVERKSNSSKISNKATF